MDNSSLNASHRYARQAIKAFNNARFDEAIHLHEEARKKIDEAIENVTVCKVVESLRLQKQFHTNQIDLIVIRREQHEKYIATQLEVDKGQALRENLESSRQVQLDLFKSLGNVEKVVEVIEQKTLSGGNREASEFLSQLFDDLKLMNHQSMLLVNRLVSQLDDRITENEELRELLESGGSVKVPQSSRTSSLEKKRSRELTGSDEDLPKELPPLELPDFNTFTSLSTDAYSADEEEKDDGSSMKEN